MLPLLSEDGEPVPHVPLMKALQAVQEAEWDSLAAPIHWWPMLARRAPPLHPSRPYAPQPAACVGRQASHDASHADVATEGHLPCIPSRLVVHLPGWGGAPPHMGGALWRGVLHTCGEHLMRHVRGAEIWPPIPTKQPCLPPTGFLSVGAVLGGGEAQDVRGKHTVKVARGANSPPCTCSMSQA